MSPTPSTLTQNFASASSSGNAFVTTAPGGAPYISLYPTGTALAAAVVQPVPTQIQSQPDIIAGSLTILGYSLKKREVGGDSTERHTEEEGFLNHYKGDLGINELQRLQRRQASGNTSTDCFFYVVETNSTGNYSIYGIDLSTLSQGQTINFNTSSFVPGPNTTVTYIEQCPPGVAFPQLNVSNLVFVTTPVSATSISSASRTTASSSPASPMSASQHKT